MNENIGMFPFHPPENLVGLVVDLGSDTSLVSSYWVRQIVSSGNSRYVESAFNGNLNVHL